MPISIRTDTLVSALSNMAMSQKTVAFGCDEIIMVPGGDIKTFSKLLMKAAGPAKKFVIFTNLPLEMREKIYRMAAPSRTIKFIEIIVKNPQDGTLSRQYKVQGAHYPVLLTASKEALSALLPCYKSLFQVEGNMVKHYFNADADMVHITSETVKGNNSPTLTLPSAIINRVDLDHIKVLALDLWALEVYKSWGYFNLEGMKCLQQLLVNGVIPDVREELFVLHMKLQLSDTECYSCSEEGELVVSKTNSIVYLYSKNGEELKNEAAFSACRDELVSSFEKDRLTHILNILEHLALETRVLPSEVFLNIRYIPL